MILGFDLECGGLDHFHGSTYPFYVSTCNDAGEQQSWEWDVDPLTRKVLAPESDLDDVRQLVASADTIIGQNIKYDTVSLFCSKIIEEWPWDKTEDTLIAAHLLASNEPHSLDALAKKYVGVDITPLEDAMHAACNEARRFARSRFPEWRIAKEDLPEMPSVKPSTKEKKSRGVDSESPWKADTWLPREIAKVMGYPRGGATLVNMLDKSQSFDVRVDRSSGSKWSSPFTAGKDGTADEVVDKYRRWLPTQTELVASLGELDGKRLGCYLSAGYTGRTHAEVLVDMVQERAHPWWTVTRDYANMDSAVLIPMWPVMEDQLRNRGLWAIYQERRKLPKIAVGLEQRGITVNRKKLYELRDRFEREASDASETCVSIAASYEVETCLKCKRLLGEPTAVFDKRCTCGEKQRPHAGPFQLDLPKGAVNDNLRAFCFNVMDLERISNHKAKSDAPTLDAKNAIPHYLTTLPKDGDAYRFIESLSDRSNFTTAVSYLNGYERYWIPCGEFNERGEQLWCRLHSSLNPTGTHHLRWSSSNPNSQNWSKGQSVCRHCDGEKCERCNFTGVGKVSLRECVAAAPGREYWSRDAKNIERRIPAYTAGETVIIELLEEPDKPPYYGSEHSLVGHIIFPKEFESCRNANGNIDGRVFKKRYGDSCYQKTKNFNFACQYQCGEATGDRTSGVKGSFRAVKSRFAKQEALNKKWVDFANENGYVETLPDREVDPDHGYPIVCERGKWGKVLPTIPLNYFSSGTAMWWTCRAMVKVQECLDEWNRKLPTPQYFMAMQVHDEIVFDFPKRADPRKNPKGSNLSRLVELGRLMESCGDGIGIPTPTGLEYHPETWATGVTF